jgi:exopolysaccharide biosynthesis protein
MAYSKTKLKSNGNEASTSFKPFLIGNMSDMHAYTGSAMRFIQTHFY